MQRFNEARNIAIAKYLEVKKQVQNLDDDDDMDLDVSEFQVLKELEHSDVVEMLEDKSIAEKFITKASTLVSEWQKAEAIKMKNEEIVP